MAGTDDRLARNREVVHRFYRAVNSKHREEFYEIVHKDFVNHGGASGDIVGPKALVDSLDPFFAAMPDWHVTEDYVLAENDKIASRGTISGTHLGSFMGIPPTNKSVSWSGIIIYRMNDEGKVIERWQDFDALGMLQQMGVVPMSGPPLRIPVDAERPPAGDMTVKATPEQIKASHDVCEKFFAAVNAKDWNAFDQVVAENCVDFDPMPIQAPGRDGLKAAYQYIAAGFPDVKHKVEEIVADGDMAIARTSVTGTNKGFYLVFPASGKVIRWTATRMFRIKNGKITATWLNMDTVGMLAQMGIIPAPAAT